MALTLERTPLYALFTCTPFIPSLLAFHLPLIDVRRSLPSHPSLLPVQAGATASTHTSQSKNEDGIISKDEFASHSALLIERVDQIINPSFSDDSMPSQSDILVNVAGDHERDVEWAKASPLPFESEANGDGSRISQPTLYDTIDDIAIQTNPSTPLLNHAEIELLRSACQSYWDRPIFEGDGASEKSRFTYQRIGNSEAHLSDIVKFAEQSDSTGVPELVNDLLLNKVYPWIREAFLSKEGGGDNLELYVYDSLFIRYNATHANLNGVSNGAVDKQRRCGAGQPLHRDMGYVSVNVMLNPNEEFEGGGTFFENQLKPTVSECQPNSSVALPLKPSGPGHALAHFSSSRHSGAATFFGVRDILVIFLAATKREESHLSRTDSTISEAPRWECNARMKSAARSYCTDCCDDIRHVLLCRMLHHRLAIEQAPDDGEAWHYLGMALLDYFHQLRDSDDAGNIWDCDNALELANLCLDVAVKHTPCDGRLYNNLGIASERLLERTLASSGPFSGHLQSSNEIDRLRDKIRASYRKSITIHSTCEEIGCDVAIDYESACLNYGLFLSKQDEFNDAVDVLSRIVTSSDYLSKSEDLDAAAWARQRVLSDAAGLLSFCQGQITNN